MLTREMQLALMERIRGYRGDPKTGQDAAAAYREFFPDAVQAHEFHDCWQAVVEEERAAAQTAATADKTSSARKSPKKTD